ncbi:MAG: hypothetical protein HEQ22_05195 [Sphingopyxis sp.]|uniref:hypothetical protein n=1 Tax=Sphingopyxis sp. TaxID=1908224 RepID=UPI003D80CCE6
MIGYIAALMLMGQPATVSVEQLDQGRSGDALAPLEQVSRGADSAFLDQDEGPGRDSAELPQISAADTEVSLGRVNGIDRCSAELLSGKDADYCRYRLENRSAEFSSRLTVPLTAEQKLLGERLTALRGTDIEGAARASGANVSAEDRDLQALASITLTDTGAQPPADGNGTDADGLSTETQALLDAIVARLANPRGD